MRRGIPFVAALLLPSLAGAVDPGDVVISELMIRSESAPEWIELYNPGAADLLLDGCVLEDATTSEALDGLSLPAGGYVVLADDAACVSFAEGGACLHATDLVYSTLTLNDTGSEELALRCAGVLIDAVTYSWAELSEACAGDATCSASLQPERLSAAQNDVWPENWCVSPPSQFVFDTLDREMRATPAAVNVCPAAGAVCGVGDAVITELMLAPTSSSREWFEIKAVAADGCDLHGCVLQEGPFADPLFDPTNTEWASHAIDADGNTLLVDSGAYALFAKSAATVVGDPDDPDETDLVFADYQYATLTFSNSEPAWLHLLCGGVAVDSVPYAWTEFSPSCAAGGCSINLPIAREDAISNDVLTAFCLPPDAPTRPSSTGQPMTGTPGAPGECLRRAWPAPGQLLFTELMAAPLSGTGGFSLPEWFELTNVGTAPAELTGCRIRRSRLDAVSGLYLPTSTSSSTTFGASADDATLPAGATEVWSRSTCLDGSDPSVSPCVGGEHLYSGIELSNSEDGRLDLVCPDGEGGEVPIVSAGYNLVHTGIRSGHSVQLDPEDADSVSSSEDPAAWCEASFQECYVTNAEGNCNYGSPGDVGRCQTGRVTSPPSGVPGCRCDAGPDAAGGPLVGAIVGLALVASARRRRER